MIAAKPAVSKRNMILSVLIHHRNTLGERLHNTAADLGFFVVTLRMQPTQSILAMAESCPSEFSSTKCSFGGNLIPNLRILLAYVAHIVLKFLLLQAVVKPYVINVLSPNMSST